MVSNPTPDVVEDDVVEELILAARDQEWQAHFGSRWKEAKDRVDDLKAKLRAALKGE